MSFIPRIRIKNQFIPKENWRDNHLPDTDITHPQLWDEYVMVDVLTVHFQKNTMRVRYPYVGTQDMKADEFFEQIILQIRNIDAN